MEQWQEWASPVWMTVQQARTLNASSAREAKDERHLCPLQLDVIERALVLWRSILAMSSSRRSQGSARKA